LLGKRRTAFAYQKGKNTITILIKKCLVPKTYWYVQGERSGSEKEVPDCQPRGGAQIEFEYRKGGKASKM